MTHGGGFGLVMKVDDRLRIKRLDAECDESRLARHKFWRNHETLTSDMIPGQKMEFKDGRRVG